VTSLPLTDVEDQIIYITAMKSMHVSKVLKNNDMSAPINHASSTIDGVTSNAICTDDVRNGLSAGTKPRQPRGDARGNPGNAENPDGKDTKYIYAD